MELESANDVDWIDTLYNIRLERILLSVTLKLIVTIYHEN